MAISKRGTMYIEHNMHCSGHGFIDACQSDNDDGIGNGGEDEVFIEEGDEQNDAQCQFQPIAQVIVMMTEQRSQW